MTVTGHAALPRAIAEVAKAAGVTMLTAILLLASFACGSGGSAPPATTPAPSTDAAILAANPAYVILASRDPSTLTPGSATQQWQITVYDSENHRVAQQFAVDDQYAAVVAGNRLVTDTGDRIVRYDLDGSHAVDLLHTAGRFIGVAVSADGTKIAVSEELAPDAYTPCAVAAPFACSYAAKTRLLVIDSATGAELTSIPQSAAGFEKFRGQATPLTWRADSEGFVVIGLTYSEGCIDVATVMLDGSVRQFPERGCQLVSPDGLYTATGTASYCSLLAAPPEQHDITVRRVVTGDMVTRTEDPSVNFSIQEWSPDSSQLLYHT